MTEEMTVLPGPHAFANRAPLPARMLFLVAPAGHDIRQITPLISASQPHVAGGTG